MYTKKMYDNCSIDKANDSMTYYSTYYYCNTLNLLFLIKLVRKSFDSVLYVQPTF